MHIFQRAACCAFFVLFGSGVGPVVAQAVSKSAPSRIVSAIDDRRVVVVPGNTHPQARAEFDRGAVDPQMPMTHVLLLLQRSSEQETALETLMAQQTDPASQNYHQWLNPIEFGQRFGPSDADLAQVTGWLQSQGLSVDKVSNGRVTIEFSGTAAQVETAFHTSLHNYVVDGVTHFANTSDPSIPEALTPVVSGVVSLHNFFARSQAVEGQRVRRNTKTGAISLTSDNAGRPGAEFTRTNSSGNTRQDVTPADFAAIYNVTPLWNSGVNGSGQTIAIAGESDITLADIATFQSSFGLANNPPTIVHNGTAPGLTSSQEEQELDVEWAGAVAPGATIMLVVSANTGSSNGFQLSAQDVIDNKLATILSESYGLCELSIGSTGNASYNSLWQQGASEGISIFGAAGDQGSAGCESTATRSSNPATTGLNVNGVASSPYITAVGGTDFLWQTSPAGTYWGTTNSSTYGTALGYIREIPWNPTCTNPYVVSLYGAASAEANCNTLGASSTTNNFVFITGGSGGVSNCTTPTSKGACAGGYAKPSWQTGTGVPTDGKRDVPDVSLFAGSGIPNGVASSSYLICYSATEPCTYNNSTDVTYQEVGGTSVSAPAMAGIMALVQQQIGSAQGLANTMLYKLAAAETSLSACNSNTASSGNSCVFYDTTTGTNAMPCKSGSANCTVNTSGDSIGVLSGYNATTGYDQATGLGSINVANLVAAWGGLPSPTITFTIPNQTYGTAPFTVSASSNSTGAFTYSIVSGPATISGSTVTLTGAGTVTVQASQAATSTYSAGSKTASFTVSQAAPTITFSIPNQSYGAASFTVSASSNSTGAFTYSIVSGPATISGSTVTLTGAGTVTVQASQAANGNFTSGSKAASFTVAQASPTITFSIPDQNYGAAPFTVSASSNSTGAFTYSIVSGPATISGSTITLTGTGTVTVQAQQAATTNYTAGSTNASFSVSQTAPTITFSIQNQTYGAAPFTVSASSNSTGAFTYSIVSGPATISGSTVTLTGAGTVTVKVSQAASGNYGSGSANASFTVAQTAPTITFTVPNQTYGAPPFTVSASSNSTGAFTYSIVSGPATISGSTITLTGAGTVTVQATQGATTNYSSGSATASFTVAQATPTITFTVPNQTYGAAPFTVSASSNSTGGFTYSVVSGPATISGATITLTGTGTVTVQAQETATTNYAAGATSTSFTVTAAAPTITFSIPNQSYGAAPFAVSASSNSPGAFIYSIVSGPATISGSTITVNGAGSVTVQAAQTASSNYSAGSATTSFTVSQANASTIQFSIPNQSYGTAPFTVNASSNSTGAFTYSIVSGPATISGSTVTVNGTGTVTVQASQAASSSYSAGSATASFNVSQAAPFITFSIPNKSYGAAPFTVSASSNSTSAFTYSIVSGPATISGSTITITGAGTVMVQANQAANGSYSAGSATASFNVSQAAPSITFSIPNQSYGAAPFSVSASSNSTGSFTYSIVLGPATISGSTLTVNGSGTVTVQASQASSTNYSAGSTTTSFNVSQANAPTVQFSIPNQSYGAAPFTVSASSNSTGAFTYAIVSGPATISGSTVTVNGAGTVMVQASQAASSNYSAGAATASFTVSQANAPTIQFSIPNQSYGVAPFTVSASSNSNGAFTYSIASGPATISGSTITVNGVGTVTVQAAQAASSNYSAGSITASFAVSQIGSSVSWSPSATSLFAGNLIGTGILDASSSVPGNISYTATLNGSAGTAITASSTLLTPGSYTLTATMTPSNPSYSASTASITLTVKAAYIWAVNPAGSFTEFHGNTPVFSAATTGGGVGAAVDSLNNLWTIHAGGTSVAEFNTSGATLQSGLSGGGLNAATALAIDGKGAVWVTNGNNSVSEFANNGTTVSPTTGYTGGSISKPTGVAIDTSGNVWVANAGNNSVTEILGAAAPAAPTTLAVQNKTLGVRP